jgi:hypothetical protein
VPGARNQSLYPGMAFATSPLTFRGERVQAMKIVILTHLEREKSKKFDLVVDQARTALKRQGHSVSVLGVHGDIRKLIAGISRRRPDVLFNMMEMFGRKLTP